MVAALGPVVLLAAACGVVLLAAACGDDGLDSPPGTGIEGLVTIGPTCPVETEASPCEDRPYEATIIIEDEDGEDVMTVESGANGEFGAVLAPGSYTLVPQSPNPGGPPFAEEQQVAIEEGRITGVTVTYDSGIR